MSVRKLALTFIVGLLIGLSFFLPVAWAKGYRMYVIHTGSMEPTLNMGTLVIDKPARDGYRIGQVITFRHSGLTTDVVTHRIIDITSAGLIETKGDANQSADAWQIRPNQVQGVRDITIPKLGYLLVFLRQPAGLVSLVTAILAICLLWGLFFPEVPAALHAATHRASPRSKPFTQANHLGSERQASSRRLPVRSESAETLRFVDATARTQIMSQADMTTLHDLLEMPPSDRSTRYANTA